MEESDQVDQQTPAAAEPTNQPEAAEPSTDAVAEPGSLEPEEAPAEDAIDDEDSGAGPEVSAAA